MEIVQVQPVWLKGKKMGANQAHGLDNLGLAQSYSY